MTEELNEAGTFLGFLRVEEKDFVYSIPVLDIPEVGPSLRLSGVSVFEGEPGEGTCVVMQANMSYHFAADLLERAIKGNYKTKVTGESYGLDLGAEVNFLRRLNAKRKAARASKKQKETTAKPTGEKGAPF